MLNWVVEILVAIIALAIPILIYTDKKRCKRADESFLDVWSHLESIQLEKERIDKQVISLVKEVEMTRQYVERQFSVIDNSQKELREFSMRQGEEIKDLIKNLASKLDKYFSGVQELNIKVVEHISKESRNGIK